MFQNLITMTTFALVAGGLSDRSVHTQAGPHQRTRSKPAERRQPPHPVLNALKIGWGRRDRSIFGLKALFTVLLASLATVFAGSGHALTSANTLADYVKEPWFGDYLAMKKEKSVRVLIPYSITGYYLDRGREKGLTVEYMREFENSLNMGIRKEIDKVRIVLVPSKRDELISGLVNGHGDIAAANLTITPERLEKVDFSNPLRRGVRELVITRKDAPDINELADLAGMEIHVRESSSYFDSLVRANAELTQSGQSPITIVTVDERLEDEDLLEMVHTGIVPAIVMDEHKANLWLGLFDDTRSHDGFALRTGGEIGWAFRKQSPELKKVVNDFIATARVGTTLGNILNRRYYSDINRLINPKTDAYNKKLDELEKLFAKYGAKYNIDPMLLAAQAFQESRFNNNARSRAGAVGIMQLLPSTARDPNVNIRNFTQLENNIEAGAKYMRFVADRYFTDTDIPDLDRILFVFASYNAGPNRVARVRQKAKDPTIWFDNVEWEVARAAGAEPIKYVKNIYIYYLVFSKFREYDRVTKKPAIVGPPRARPASPDSK